MRFSLVALALSTVAPLTNGQPIDYRQVAIEVTSTFDEKSIFADAPIDAQKWHDLFWQDIACYAPTIPPERFSSSMAAFEAGDGLLRGGQLDFARKLVAGIPVSDEILFSALINGWLKARDRYADWETAGDAQQWATLLSGKLRGIGLRWSPQRSAAGNLVVEETVPGAPAATAGITAGMEVQEIQVDGKQVDFHQVRTPDMATMIQGANLVTLRSGSKEYHLVPSEIVLKGQTVGLTMEGATPVISIPHFDRGTAAAVASLLTKEQGVSALIIDFRGCGGGYTNEGTDLIGYLRGKGEIGVDWHYRDEVGRQRQYPMTTDVDKLWNGQSLIFRVDRDTASAAELVLMAMKGEPGVHVIGGPTHGKTTSQDVVEISSGSKLRVSVAQFAPSESRN